MLIACCLSALSGIDCHYCKVLNHFQKNNQATPPATQAPVLEDRWQESRRAEIAVPADAVAQPDKPYTVSVAWLMPSGLDELEEIGVRVVADLLLSGPEAAFYEPLVCMTLLVPSDTHTAAS